MRLTTPQGPAELSFAKGVLVGVEYDGSIDDEALARLVVLNEGDFEVVFTESPHSEGPPARRVRYAPSAPIRSVVVPPAPNHIPETTEKAPLAERPMPGALPSPAAPSVGEGAQQTHVTRTTAVTEGRRARGAEWGRLLEQGWTPSSILSVDRTRRQQIPLKPSEAVLLHCFDGRREIGEVLELAGSSVANALTKIASWIDCGMLTDRPSASSAPPNPVKLPTAGARIPEAHDMASSTPREESECDDQEDAEGSRYSSQPGSVEVVRVPDSLHQGDKPSSELGTQARGELRSEGLRTSGKTERGAPRVTRLPPGARWH